MNTNRYPYTATSYSEAINSINPAYCFSVDYATDPPTIQFYEEIPDKDGNAIEMNFPSGITIDVINTKRNELESARPMALLRILRDAKIAESDWMGNSDYPMTDAWKTYRQALRDLPANSSPSINASTNELENVTWPTEPS